MQPLMRVAALYDIHGNLPALEAVLDDVRSAGVDEIVVGGDVVPGPMPAESLQRLLDLGVPTHFIYGNGERAVLAQLAGARTGSVTYWGTASGARPPERIVDVLGWSAEQLPPYLEPVLARWPMTVQLEIDGLGTVLFCHSTPRNETEIFTRTTPEELLRPLIEPLHVDVLVCGHTHMQFDRRVGSTRVVNAGSVGAPFGDPGAYWLLLGPHVELVRTTYDVAKAAERIRGTSYPDAAEFVQRSMLTPPTEQVMLEVFSRVALTP
ncbi:MAG TPA: metallophosphoesterase family protein [Gemmatimonadaceae bacterium]|nr:metallophosphoesterase family protein [Gemmatimonadaceae bacterium]